MKLGRPRVLPSTLALALAAAAPVAFSAEVWTTITSPALNMTATTATGTLGSTTVTFTSVTDEPLLHLSSGPVSDGAYQHIWDNATTGTVDTGSTAYTIEPNNAAIYPASAATAPSQVVLDGDRPADYQVTFGRPITDPVLLVYSVETNTALNFSATRTEGGVPATVKTTTNIAGHWDEDAQVLSAVRSRNDGWSLEGCSKYQTWPSKDETRPSRRACAVMRFTGTYSAIQFSSSRNDGVGFQVGFDDPTLDPIVPVPTLTQTGLVALGLGMLGFAAWRTRRGGAGRA